MSPWFLVLAFLTTVGAPVLALVLNVWLYERQEDRLYRLMAMPVRHPDDDLAQADRMAVEVASRARAPKR